MGLYTERLIHGGAYIQVGLYSQDYGIHIISTFYNRANTYNHVKFEVVWDLLCQFTD